MAVEIPGGSKGLLNSLTALAATLVAIAHTRLELLSTDLEAEREHIFSLLVRALATLFSLGVGTVLAAIVLVIAFWDTHRVLALSALAGFFLAVGMAGWFFTMHKIRTKPRLLTSSLSELSKDRQQLVSSS